MAHWPKLIVSLTFGLCAASPGFGSVVYVDTGGLQFGTLDLTSGTFAPIGHGLSEPSIGLAPDGHGHLLTLGASGNLDSIDPSTGVETTIGATGLADCTTPQSPCGPRSANSLASAGGVYYANDFQGNLYRVNPTTGATTLIGSTGMPGVTFVPFGAPNADGTLNLYGGSLFGANGNLYATFDTGALDPNTGTITPVIPDTLYQIDTSTGHATAIGSTDFSLDAFANINGTTVAFKNLTGELESLDLSTGGTTTIGTFDQSGGLVFGAAAAPEPSGIALAVIGIAAVGFWRKRRGRCPADRSV